MGFFRIQTEKDQENADLQERVKYLEEKLEFEQPRSLLDLSENQIIQKYLEDHVIDFEYTD